MLAAGASARLGVPKALVELGLGPTTSPLALLLSRGAALGDAPSLVVTGPHHEAITAALEADAPPVRVEILRNRGAARGRAGSVLCARDARPGRDLCLAPVDVPLVSRATFAALRAAWIEAGAPPRGWLAPRFAEPERGAGRYGHPVILGRELLSGWTPATLDEPLRTLRERARPLLGVDVTDAAILDDLDTPEDLARLRAREAASGLQGDEPLDR